MSGSVTLSRHLCPQVFTSSTTARQQQSAAQQKLQEFLAAVQDTAAELQKSERLAEDLESALASHSQVGPYQCVSVDDTPTIPLQPSIVYLTMV